jgi:hypothetical protein
MASAGVRGVMRFPGIGAGIGSGATGAFNVALGRSLLESVCPVVGKRKLAADDVPSTFAGAAVGGRSIGPGSVGPPTGG